MFNPQKLEQLHQRLQEWESNTLLKTLTDTPRRQGSFIPPSPEPVERLYTPLDLADFDYLNDLGFPGEYPYTRGVHPTLHRGKLWTMRMFAGFGTAEETNQRFRYLLEQGQTGLSVALDLPSQCGHGPDCARARSVTISSVPRGSASGQARSPHGRTIGLSKR